ncbi:hypothetical protein E2C01_034408 [Portunus trituberculatus]|uniref:Uncharacterized protein n=1 Tax=Portunus trituberculatus TaxID=210409 RepID=A0A5B7F6X3_PORTR|nr:hypothetical protein [Portunus trituberculatus]
MCIVETKLREEIHVIALRKRDTKVGEETERVKEEEEC